MPERNLDGTIKRLTPMLNDPELGKKIDDAAAKNTAPQTSMNNNEAEMNDSPDSYREDEGIGNRPNKVKGKKNANALQTVAGNNSMLGQVVGIIIGSPEFQRR